MITPATRRNKFEHIAFAHLLWRGMTKSQKYGIRFGLFPHQLMSSAEEQGYDGRALSIELMKVAARNGGMQS